MSSRKPPLSINRLIDRWKHEQARIAAILSDLLSGQDWTRNLLADQEQKWAELEGLWSCQVPKLPLDSAPRDLRGMTFADIDLTNVKGLADSCLDYSVFAGTILRGVSFVGTSLRSVRVLSGTVCDGASFSFSDLTEADLRESSFSGADFSNCDIRGADLRDSEIRDCNFSEVKYRMEGTLGSFGFGGKPTRFGGTLQSPDRLGDGSSRELRQYVREQVRQSDFERLHPAFSKISYWLTNFGRSPGRLLIWVVLSWLSFGLLYVRFPLPRWLEGTAPGVLLVNVGPTIVESANGEPVNDLVRSLYFSAVTLTTLGFGDIVPRRHDWLAEICVSLEAIVGYILLGAFVSLLLRSFVPVAD